MRLVWSKRANQDRREIVEYIWPNDRAAAIRIDRLIRSAAQRLLKYPYIGRVGLIPGTRELIPHGSYRIVYRALDAEIRILMVVHTSRQWPPEPDE